MEIALLAAIGVAVLWFVRKMNRENALANSSHNHEQTNEYSQKMGQFKETTLNYIVDNYCPIKELSKDTSMHLLTYLLDASSAACRYAGMDERYKDIAHLALLKQMGIRDGEAQGMLAAISKPLPLGNDMLFDQGGSAFNSWIREGDAAAHSHIRDAMTMWESISDINDEITAYARPSHDPANNDPDFSLIAQFGDKVADALSHQILLFAPNGVFPDRAKDSWSTGYIVGFTDAMLQSHESIEQHNWGGVEISVLLRLFGEEQGRISIDKYHNSFAEGKWDFAADDSSLRDGMMIGEEDITRCLADNSDEGYTPIRWSAYVNEQSEETT